MKQLEVGPEYIHNLIQLARSQGASTDQLYAAAELEYDPRASDEAMALNAPDYSRLYSAAIRLAGDECFGYLGPGRFPCGTFGVFCEYLLPARTLGEVLQRASSFFNWMQKLQHRSADLKPLVPYRTDEAVATLFFINQSSSASSVFITQRAIASVLSSWHNFLCWLIDTDMPLLEVQLQGRCQVDEQRYHRVFRAPIRYQQAQNACLVSARFLEAPVAHSQESLEDFLHLAPYHLVASSERDCLEYSVSNQVKKLLDGDFSGRPPGMEKTAKKLSMSARSLRSGLEREGTSLQGLRDEARFEAAIRHLRDPRLSIDDIAVRLGYDEPEALHSAFSSWSGLTPIQYREQLTSN